MTRDDGQERNRSDTGIISRRRLLRTGSAAALGVGLAGCGGNSGGGNNSGGGDNGGNGGTGGNGGGGGGSGDGSNNGNGGNGGGGGNGQPVDSSFTTFTGAVPTNSQYNYYNPAQYASLNDMLYNQLWRYNWRTDGYHDRIGTNYSVKGTTAMFDVDTDYKWSDGKPVNATDVEKQLTLERYIEDPIWDFIDGVKTQGNTVTLQLKSAYNPKVFRAVLGQARYIVVKRGSPYDKNWLSKFENAGGDDEVASIRDDFLTWQYAKDTNDPIANGPYVVGDVSSSEWTMNRNENFPYQTNIPHYVYSSSSSDQQNWQKAISGKLDGWGILALPTNIKQQLPGSLQQITLGPVSIYAPIFNFDTVWGSRELRQAFAYLLDKRIVIQNVNPRQALSPRTTGLTSDLTNQYLDDSFLGQLTNYGVESKPDEATRLLQQAGFQKQGGTWTTPDGDQVSMEWVGPSFPGSIGFAETLNQFLPDFGIDYQSTILSPPEWITRRSNGQFDLTFDNLGGGPHPYFYLDATVASDRSEYGNYPRETLQLPPVGKPNASPQQFDIAGVLQDLATANNEGQLRSATKRYAWYFNQELPHIQAAESTFPTYISTDDWDVPNIDADVMGIQSPLTQLLRETKDGSNRALIQAKTN